MKIVFFGTPEFAVKPLNKLIESNHDILAVVTRPDKPKGRGRKVCPSPVKQVALENNLKVLQPEKLLNIKEELKNLGADVFVVVAYGKLLPPWILYMATHKCINIHPSLLPKYRGPAPIERTIMNGDKKTGVTTMRLSEGMDDGPIYLQEVVEIGEDENSDSLKNRLSEISSELLSKTLRGIDEGSLEPKEQDHTKSTVIGKLTKEEEKIDWNQPTETIHNKIRALSTKPGAYCFYKGKRLKILKSFISISDVVPVSPNVIPSKAGIQISHQVRNDKMSPGIIIKISRDSFLTATGDGTIEVLQVQPEGRNPMSASEFIRGFKPQVGESLT
jgi:methionyl-tRNA formyltransferase